MAQRNICLCSIPPSLAFSRFLFHPCKHRILWSILSHKAPVFVRLVQHSLGTTDLLAKNQNSCPAQSTLSEGVARDQSRGGLARGRDPSRGTASFLHSHEEGAVKSLRLPMFATERLK